VCTNMCVPGAAHFGGGDQVFMCPSCWVRSGFKKTPTRIFGEHVSRMGISAPVARDPDRWRLRNDNVPGPEVKKCPHLETRSSCKHMATPILLPCKIVRSS
jgi:hypothetical protein